MSIFKDFLIYYDNLDVHCFVQAVKKMQQFYFDHHIVLFRLDVSVPIIARQWIFQMAHDVKGSFGLVQPQDNDLYCIIKQNIVGGPSIIFTHDAEVLCTFLQNDPNRPVSQMWALLAACSELAFNYATLPKLLYGFFFYIKRNKFWSMPHIPAMWYFNTSVTYPQWFRGVKFVVISPSFV